MPSVTDGFSSEKLAEIYNIFDIYVQYAICEGFGMPQVEAGACGVPIMTVDYSAMCDVVKKLNATPIKIQTKFKELETKAFRVYPDNEDLVEKIIKFISLPESIRDKQRYETRQLTEKNYNWDEVSKKWENYFDKIDQLGYRANWQQSHNLINPIPIMSNDKDKNFENMFTACTKYLGDQNLISSNRMLNMLKDSDYGFAQVNTTQIIPFSYQNIQEFIQTLINNQNNAEIALSKNISFDDDFITYAKIKNQK